MHAKKPCECMQRSVSQQPSAGMDVLSEGVWLQEAVRLREAFLEITGRQGAFTAEGVIDV